MEQAAQKARPTAAQCSPNAPMQFTGWPLFAQSPEELFETTSQCLLSGVDRDALSGWGAIIYVV